MLDVKYFSEAAQGKARQQLHERIAETVLRPILAASLDSRQQQKNLVLSIYTGPHKMQFNKNQSDVIKLKSDLI